MCCSPLSRLCGVRTCRERERGGRWWWAQREGVEEMWVRVEIYKREEIRTVEGERWRKSVGAEREVAVADKRG